jgi:hypothetical protein
VVLGEAGTDADPVVGAASKTVDHEKRLPVPAKVEELDRPVQVYSPMPHCVNGTPDDRRKAAVYAPALTKNRGDQAHEDFHDRGL